MDYKDIFTNFINELELSFEYIPKITIDKLRSYLLNKVQNETEKDNVYQILNKHKDILLKFYNERDQVNTKKNISKTIYNFFEDLVIFDNILDFSIFKNENKNTKKVIVNYLSDIYVCIKPAENLPNESINQISLPNKLPQELTQMLSGVSGVSQGGFNIDMISKVMNNQGINELMSKVQSKLQENNQDPMQLLMSLVSGQQNKSQENFLSSIQEIVTTTLETNSELKESLSQIVNQIDK